MGAFDAPTGTALGQHIFVSEKADYYQIKDGLPQNQTYAAAQLAEIIPAARSFITDF